MTTNPTELERFRQFIDRKLSNGGRETSLADAAAEFAAYEAEVSRLRAELQQSIAEAQRGEARPLDVAALIQEIRDELAYCG